MQVEKLQDEILESFSAREALASKVPWGMTSFDDPDFLAHNRADAAYRLCLMNTNKKLDAAGVKDHTALQDFMDALETRAQEREITVPLRELYFIRDMLSHRRRPPFINGPNADPTRMNALKDMIRNKATVADIAQTIEEIIYRDVREKAHLFFNELGVFIVEERQFDLLQNKALMQGIEHTWHTAKHPHDTNAASHIQQGAFTAIWKKVFTDPDYYKTIPRRYYPQLVEAMHTTPDLAPTPMQGKIMAELINLVGEKSLQRMIKRAEAHYKKELEFEQSGYCEGGTYAANALEALHTKKLILADFNARAAKKQKTISQTPNPRNKGRKP